MNAIIKALKKALEADPSNWETRQALVESYQKEGLDAEAFALLDEIEAQPENEGALIEAALSYAVAGSRDGGRGIIQKVLDRNPASAEAHVALAKIAHRGDDTQTAMRHYVTATSLNSSITDTELEAAYGSLLDSIGLRKSAPAPAEAGTEVIAEPEPASIVEPVPEQEAVVIAEAESEAIAVAVVAEEESTPVEEDSVAVAAEAEPEPVPAAAVRSLSPPLPPQRVEEPSSTVEKTGAATVPLISRTTQARTADLAEAEPTPTKARDAVPVSVADSVPVLIAQEDADEEIDYEPDPLAEELRYLKEEIEEKRRRAIARDKMASLTVTILLHVGAFFLLTLVVTSVRRDVPPQIVAASAQAEAPDQIQNETLKKTQIRPDSAASSPTTDIISAESFSAVSVSNVESTGVGISANLGMDFAPSMSFGDASMSPDSKMLFGQKLDGEVLGVILDVSGSMAEYLPVVVKEVDKSFKNAPIVYVNHVGMVGATKDCEIYPIIPDEVLPSWPKEWNKGQISPFWFLWGDLPRKAEQRHVDRLIETFKTRPNMFIARGGNNRVGAAADFLVAQKCDSLYIFSDFEDFVDEEYCTTLGQKLGRAKVKTYVQPVAARSEHLAILSRRVSSRSMGRELPPLSDLLRPGDEKPAPIAVAVKQELPVPEGVRFATPRAERPVDPLLGYNHNRWWDDNQQLRFKDVVKIAEYPNFDIVINGPEARALIYMKGKDGFVQSPIVFGYYSHKPFFEESSGKTYYPRRKWLRNEEEPTFDGNELTWKMVLEDEIKFTVIFWFKEDTLTGTYTAQIPPNGESDGAFIYFSVPPIGIERQDMYYSPDFPGGLDLDQLRQVMAHNHATFYLPVQAEDRLGVSWSRLGFKKGENVCPYNFMYRTLPDGVREVTIGGRSFGERRLQARTTSNNLLLTTGTWRADIELWEGFQCRLVRPRDRRERVVKTEAIAFGIE
jgi:tetratricopeptide (TPR) repeat protein